MSATEMSPRPGAKPTVEDEPSTVDERTPEEIRMAELMVKYPRPASFSLDKKGRNPEERANVFSIWSLHYLSQLVSLGSKRPLVESDMWEVSKEQNCFFAAPELEANWLRRMAAANEFNAAHGHPLVGVDEGQAKSAPVAPAPAPESASAAEATATSPVAASPDAPQGSNPGAAATGEKKPLRREPFLFTALCALAPWNIAKMMFLQALVRTEQIYESVVLGYLLTWLVLDSPVPGFEPEDEYWGYIYGVGLALMYLGQSVCNNRSMSIGFNVYSTVRSALNGVIYTKAIKVASIDAANDSGNRTAVAGGPMMGGGGNAGSGQVVNLMAVDSEKVGMVFFMGLNVVFIPPQLAVIIYFIYEQVGVAIFAGLGVLLVVLPIIFCIMRCLGGFLVRRAIIGDSRVKLTNELLQGIRIVKFYAWEYFFDKKIAEIRNSEVDVLFSGFLTQMAMTFFFSISSPLLAAVTFAVYAALEDEMPPVKIFRTLTLINALQVPLIQLPASLNNIMMGLISMERIRQFLMLPELTAMQSTTSEGPLKALEADTTAAQAAALADDARASPAAIEAAAAKAEAARLALDATGPAPEVGQEVDGSTVLAHDSEYAFELDDCAFAWEIPSLPSGPARGGRGGRGRGGPPGRGGAGGRGGGAGRGGAAGGRAGPGGPPGGPGGPPAARPKRVRVLADINFKAPRGKITAIVGPVGCGKTSLVSGLLGELTKTHGRVSKDVSASVAYVAQSAWIQTMSIRKNVLFGGELTSEADEIRYERTLDVCALRPDLTTLEAGDLTEIGDRGINLSGGQKQRVSIARAVYADADIVIFDDPLSAVDAHVAEHIFSQCIEGELAGRTRILVTNQLHFLSRCDHVVVMGQRTDNEAAADAAQAAAHAAAEAAEAATAAAVAEAAGVDADDDAAPVAAAAGAAGPSSGDSPVDGASKAPSSGSLPVLARSATPSAGSNGPSIRQLGYIAEQGDFATLFAEGTVLPGLLQQYYSSLEERGNAASSQEPTTEALALAAATGEAPGEAGVAPEISRLAHPSQPLSPQEKEELAVTMRKRAESISRSAASRRLSHASRHSASRGSGFFDHNTSALPSAGVDGLIEESSDDSDGEKERALQFATVNPAAGGQLAANLAAKSARENAAMDAAALSAGKQEKQTHLGGQLRKGQQIADEELNTGSVSWGAYLYHMRTMGPLPLVFLLLLITACSQAAQAIMSIWLSWWSDNTFNHRMNWYLHIYLGLLGALAFLTLLRGFSFAIGNVNSSRFYHHRLVRIVLRAKSVFFDTTPVGRILNRFSKDMDAVDSIIPSMLQQLMVLMFGLLASVITVCIIIPYFAIGLAVVIILFFLLHRYYSPVAVQLQRLESNTRSPLFQHFSETIKGMATIRAFRKVAEFQRNNFNLNNVNTSTLFLTRQVYRWGGLRIGLLQSLLLLAAVLVIVGTRGQLAVGLAGSAVTYLLSIGSTTGFLIMMMIELASRMNSIERIKYFMYNTEAEASLETPTGEEEPPAEWPERGEIEYKNVEMRYRPELPLVLNGLSFKIKPGTKVGVVGRTGSGKSSLMMLLMRLYEIESGQILIDGVDIRTLGLHRLRGSIGIVPQEAVMFSGTLRENLDPFSQYTDEELLDALDQVALREFALALSDGLDHTVKEFGSNFSVGQRQLICMARVLLKKPRVLLLDEATSSVDSETDALLQQALQRRFADCTVLTIAHRLNTVMHSDAIMVLDGGTLAEFGSPRELLRGTGLWEGDEADPSVQPGLFAKMYQAYLSNNKDKSGDADAAAAAGDESADAAASSDAAAADAAPAAASGDEEQANA